jgi:hypothetical protein
VNWKAGGGERWLVPLGLSLGQVVKFGARPVNLQAAAFYNVARPTGAPGWTLEFQAQFMFQR